MPLPNSRYSRVWTPPRSLAFIAPGWPAATMHAAGPAVSSRRRFVVVAAVFAGFVVAATAAVFGRADEAPVAAVPAPVMTVELVTPRLVRLPVQVPATGHVMAWQEASIGSEAEGLRLADVRVNVGDAVVRGQVLATFHDGLVRADVAEADAAVAVAEAEASEADGNARRAQRLEGSGALSAQQISQMLAAAAVARARLDAARAGAARQRVRMSQVRVRAPSDGVITRRSATVGAVAPAGQELFRMIRDGRLEWRARVAVSDLGALMPGQTVSMGIPAEATIRGTLRAIKPDIDPQTNSGLVYVDLPRDAGVRAGAFATGHVEVGEVAALTLPQSAVLLRDGFHQVMRVGTDARVVAVKVEVGRRLGDRIEITRGLAETEAVVASGLGFLSEGDSVRVASATGTGPDRAGGMPVPTRGMP